MQYLIHCIKRIFQFVYYSLFKQEKFYFNGKYYNYFYSLWNVTFSNERAIEIPLALELIKQYKYKDILEVGNVMKWYSMHKHDVVDLYDVEDWNCIHVDIARYKTDKKYDLIISVSTLEHIGFDEEIKNPCKIFSAVKNMKSMLKPGGLMFVTIPIGYNPYIPWGDLGLTFQKLKWRNGYEIAVGYYHLQA